MSSSAEAVKCLSVDDECFIKGGAIGWIFERGICLNTRNRPGRFGQAIVDRERGHQRGGDKPRGLLSNAHPLAPLPNRRRPGANLARALNRGKAQMGGVAALRQRLSQGRGKMAGEGIAPSGPREAAERQREAPARRGWKTARGRGDVTVKRADLVAALQLWARPRRSAFLCGRPMGMTVK